MFNSIVYNRNIEFNWFVLDEAYEKFIFQLDLPAESFSCNDCPGELLEDDSEENYKDVIECHIADGIDMGKYNKHGQRYTRK